MSWPRASAGTGTIASSRRSRRPCNSDCPDVVRPASTSGPYSSAVISLYWQRGSLSGSTCSAAGRERRTLTSSPVRTGGVSSRLQKSTLRSVLPAATAPLTEPRSPPSPPPSRKAAAAAAARAHRGMRSFSRREDGSPAASDAPCRSGGDASWRGVRVRVALHGVPLGTSSAPLAVRVARTRCSGQTSSVGTSETSQRSAGDPGPPEAAAAAAVTGGAKKKVASCNFAWASMPVPMQQLKYWVGWDQPLVPRLMPASFLLTPVPRG
mmetsp:Transcript_43829/g.145101  ORF Transcript_43829/g.145101 Transcript_43829/m.145101 type:complete len:266 (-) Transcript_43829:1538-2335(-)